MKRIVFLVILTLIIALTWASVAYLKRAKNISINLSEIEKVKEAEAKLFLKGSWGTSEGQFGMKNEDWVPGPMSLTAGPNNHLYILDQENKRVQRFSENTKLLNVIKIDNTNYEDIAIDEEGFIYLLDSVSEHLVKKININGKIIRTYSLAKSIHPITGLFVKNKQVLVETNHDKLYIIGSTSKTKSSVSQLKSKTSGRTGTDFKTEVELTRQGGVEAQIKGHHPLDSISITGHQKVYSIISVDSDDEENIYIVLDIAESDKLYNLGKDKLLGLVINNTGVLKSKFYASNSYYTAHFRKFALSPNGTVYQMQTKLDGVVVWKW
ncbi:MAG: hypothetical protein E3J54_01980 [Actinobacteria bacterium]|nr:MAG: hypothetical protein E3J54_01980 [Actinomycetota bacterium]